MQSYGIEYGTLHGDLRDDDIWDRLVNIMYKPRYKDLNIDPNPYFVEVGFIDVQGGFTDLVMHACHRSYILNHELLGDSYIDMPQLYPIKGQEGANSDKAPLLKYWDYEEATTRTSKDDIKNEDWFKKINALNTYLLKNNMFADLSKRVSLENKEEFGLCKFVNWNGYKGHENYNKEYFRGLCSESRVYKLNRSKGWHPTFKKTRKRNEPVDCRIYNIAAYIWFRRSIDTSHPCYNEISKCYLNDTK